MKIYRNIYIALLCFVTSIAVFGFSVYHYCLSGPSNDSSLEVIEIKPGSIDAIATDLEGRGYIRNKMIFKLYVKITGKNNLKAGTYSLSKDMGVVEIVNILEDGSSAITSYIDVLFKEGLNIRQIAKVIEDNTNNTADMVFLMSLLPS